jgi:hypothetical protein
MRKPIVCALAATLLTGGCYTYAEPPATGVSRGQAVRVLLTDAGTAAVAPWVGPRVVSISGRLMSSADSAVTLALTTTEKRNGTDDLWRGEPVLIRREYIESLQRRTFSGSRTFVAGGVAVGLAAILYAALGGFNGSSSSGSGGPAGGR